MLPYSVRSSNLIDTSREYQYFSKSFRTLEIASCTRLSKQFEHMCDILNPGVHSTDMKLERLDSGARSYGETLPLNFYGLICTAKPQPCPLTDGS